MRIGHGWENNAPTDAHDVTRDESPWTTTSFAPADGSSAKPWACGSATPARTSVTHNEIADFSYSRNLRAGWRWGYAESLAQKNVIDFNHIHHHRLGRVERHGRRVHARVPRADRPSRTTGSTTSTPTITTDGAAGGSTTTKGSSDFLMENNLVYNTKTGGYHQHYGRDNIGFATTSSSSRWTGRSSDRVKEDHVSFCFTNNIVYWNNESPLLSRPATDETRRFQPQPLLECGGQGRLQRVDPRGVEESCPVGRARARWWPTRCSSMLAAGDFHLKPGSPGGEDWLQALRLHEGGRLWRRQTGSRWRGTYDLPGPGTGRSATAIAARDHPTTTLKLSPPGSEPSGAAQHVPGRQRDKAGFIRTWFSERAGGGRIEPVI